MAPLGIRTDRAFARASLVAVLCATVLACRDSSGPHVAPPNFAAKPFDRARWIATHDGRGAMVDDLIAHHLPPGMARADVAALLGIEIAGDAAHASMDLGATPNGHVFLELDFDAEGRLFRAYTAGL